MNEKTKKLHLLYSKLRKAKDELHQEANLELQDIAQLMSFDRVQNLAVQCEILKQNVNELEEKSSALQKNLLKYKFLVENRQYQLLRDLLTIYPISGTGEKDFVIRDLEVPVDLSLTKDDEATAVALGFIVHIILLISKYFKCPLRYQLLYMGSRSLVRDYGTNTTVPLFRRNMEKERFERAVMWLKADVEQIMTYLGIFVDRTKSLPYQLRLLFKHQTTFRKFPNQ